MTLPLIFFLVFNLLLRAALPCPSTLPPCGQGVKRVQSCRPTPVSDDIVVCTNSGGQYVNICSMTNDISPPKLHSMRHPHPNPTSSPCHPLPLWSPRPCWDSEPSLSPLVFPMQLTWWTTWLKDCCPCVFHDGECIVLLFHMLTSFCPTLNRWLTSSGKAPLHLVEDKVILIS